MTAIVIVIVSIVIVIVAIVIVIVAIVAAVYVVIGIPIISIIVNAFTSIICYGLLQSMSLLLVTPSSPPYKYPLGLILTILLLYMFFFFFLMFYFISLDFCFFCYEFIQFGLPLFLLLLLCQGSTLEFCNLVIFH